MNILRTLSLDNLSTSCFLFGPRQAGKTWLLKNTVKFDMYIDLLSEKERIRYIKSAGVLLSEIAGLNKKKALIVIDEIQKAPGLLDEVHRAIESPLKPIFILTGSSARKLKRNQANMLGGRAITFRLFPFSYFETKNTFSLQEFLHYGGIPNIYLADDNSIKKMMLESYVNTYLKEEIFDEALTRNLPAFTKFLDLAGFENSRIINYSNIAKEIGVSSKLIKEYFNILEDTYLGFYLTPYTKSHRKRLVLHPKFYLIDTGIAFAIKKMLGIELQEGTPIFGNAFEHFIILETKKAISYNNEEINMYFFRTSDGAEVDLILEKHDKTIAIEIKSSALPQKLSGIRSFLKDHSVSSALCVCGTPRVYEQNGVRFLPWQKYIQSLYEGTIFS